MQEGSRAAEEVEEAGRVVQAVDQMVAGALGLVVV